MYRTKDSNFFDLGNAKLLRGICKQYTFIVILLILLSTMCFQIGTTSSQPSGIRLSWISDTTDTTMTIVWETSNFNNPNEVQYGLTTACELGTKKGFSFADSWGVNSNHQVELTGLSPNTKYHYKVSGDIGEWSSLHSFTTAPQASINWTFLVAGDSRSYYNDWGSVVSAMDAFPEARLLFFGGDVLSNFDTQSEWNSWVTPASQLIADVPFITNKGNHEGPFQNFYNCFAFPPNEQWFSFNYGSAHFIVLDSEDSGNSAQKTWLQNDLQAAAGDPDIKWIFASFHRPPYSSGGHDSDSGSRSNFAPLLRDYGVDMVFSGHNHFYQRSYPLDCTDINNPVISDYSKTSYYYPETIYSVVGRAGAPAYTPSNSQGWFVDETMSSSLHYMKIDIFTNGSLHATTRYTDNIIFDDFWVIKNGTPPPPPPPPPPTNTITLISAGDSWRYSEIDPQPNPNWNLPGFDDSPWSSGPAPFGFGDSTSYGTVLNDNDGSYYFRKTFYLEPGTVIDSAKVNVSSDNYAQVYLNGIMIDDDSGANHEFAYWNRVTSVSPNAFQDGTNTVAVFVYNSAGSSDAYMDLELTAKTPVSNGSNSPPTITSSDDTSAIEGELYSVAYTANDPDMDPLTWSLVSDAPWLNINPSSGVLSGTPSIASVGSYQVNVTVSDAHGASDSSQFDLSVYMAIPLSPGWNLVSVPLAIQDMPIEDLLQSIEGKYDSVEAYDASDAVSPWKIYHISKPDHMNDQISIGKNTGFWLHVTDPLGATLAVSETKLSGIQDITLNAGWNLVGFPSMTSQVVSDITSNLAEPINIMGINSSQGYPHYDIMNSDDVLLPKNGYWVHSPVSQAWSIAPQGNDFFSVSGSDLMLNGDKVTLVGANSYGILSGYLGIGYVTDTVADSTQRFVDANGNDIRILRFWLDVAPSDYWFGKVWEKWTGPGDHSTYFAALDALIADAKANDIYLVPSLASAYDQWTAQGSGENFWVVGSQSNLVFKDWVGTIVTHYANEPQIAFWELANEANYFCKIWVSRATQAEVIAWAQDITSHIKSLDSNHLVEGGWNNMGNMNMADFDALNNFLDLASHHIYDKDLYALQQGQGISDQRTAVDDYVMRFTNYAHNNLGMPILFGEIGCNLTADPQNPYIRWFLESAYNYSSDLALIWSWEEGYPTDDYLVTPTIRPVIAQDLSYWSQKFQGLI